MGIQSKIYKTGSLQLPTVNWLLAFSFVIDNWTKPLYPATSLTFLTHLPEMGQWPVLHDRPTVASLHRSVRAPRRRSAPRDSLDLHLLSCYQHNREIFPDTSDVIRHPSRLEELAFVTTAPETPREEDEQGIVYGGLRQRPSIHSVKLGIGANHIAQTNAGFSRKLDGTFYSL